jgi:hypothetical protein
MVKSTANPECNETEEYRYNHVPADSNRVPWISSIREDSRINVKHAVGVSRVWSTHVTDGNIESGDERDDENGRP